MTLFWFWFFGVLGMGMMFMVSCVDRFVGWGVERRVL